MSTEQMNIYALQMLLLVKLREIELRDNYT